MWKLLKADLNYNKGGLCFLFGIAIILFPMAAIWKVIDLYVFMGVMTMLFWIIMAMIGAEEDKEQRERKQSLLPIPLKQFGIVRQLFVIFNQAFMFILWILLLFIVQPVDMGPVFRDMLSMNALILIVISVFVIFHDLKYSACKICRFLFLVGVFGVLALFGYLHFLGIMRYPLNFGPVAYKSLIETIIFIIVCLGLIVWNFNIFIRRRSYLN